MSRKTLRAISMTAVGVAALVAAAPAALAGTVDTSPHNYMGDGNTVDTYGGPSLVWSGTPHYIPVAGTYAGDQAFSFDGASSLASPSATTVNYGTSNFSLSFTFATTSDVQQALVNKRSSCDASSPYFDVRMGANPDFIYAELNDAGNTAGVTVQAPASLADGKYHTVFVTRSGKTFTASVDGAFGSLTSASVVNLDTPAPLTFGADPCDGSPDTTKAFTGAINSVQFNVTPPPTASLPEAPYAVSFGLIGMGILGSAVVIRRRA